MVAGCWKNDRDTMQKVHHYHTCDEDGIEVAFYVKSDAPSNRMLVSNEEIPLLIRNMGQETHDKYLRECQEYACKLWMGKKVLCVTDRLLVVHSPGVSPLHFIVVCSERVRRL